jgi:LacI family transcriptional regulator, galactose operon repressor
VARRYVSIKEVAARAGVSFQTASKVLNGGSVRVSAQTAARIIEVASQLGYQPNTLARSLVRRTTGTLGLVATDVTDVAISQVSVSVEQAARRQGHAVLVGHLSPGGEDGAEVVQMLIERRVDGIIAAAPQLEEDAEVAALLRTYVPAVSLHSVPGGGVPVIGSNHRETGRLATEHLMSHGHRVIGTITGPFRRRVVRSRLHGYEDALRAAGIEPEEDLVAEADWTPQRAAEATLLLLQRLPRVTALFVHNDTMAIGVLGALAAAGLRVPADMAVVGCDDVPFAEYLVPPLTTVHVPLAEAGEHAVDLLLRAIRGEQPPQRPVRLPVGLVVRASCGTHPVFEPMAGGQSPVPIPRRSGQEEG